MRFFILDVFGVEKYSGNQLAVVLLENPLPETSMQRIAREFNFSETTFIQSYDAVDNEYTVRIFTPYNEVPFAGHPTLGSAYIIRNEVMKQQADTIVLKLKVGPIPVAFGDKGILWMRQNEPVFGSIHEPANLAPVINLALQDIDTRFPIQDVSTGLEFTVVPLLSLRAIQRAATRLSHYKDYFKDKGEKPLFLFCPETHDPSHQLHCRMFADIFGIPEDPATGSANGCLAGYCVKYSYFNTDAIAIKVEQGFEMGRKSLLHLEAAREETRIVINVGGNVFKVAEGRLL